jgi:putative SOS response-associated peptidase YedK
MCGRFVFHLPPAKLKELLGLDNLLNIKPRYNCAPMQEQAIVIKNRMGHARWGFRPSWAREDDVAMAAKMINARSETVAEKAAFKEAWSKGRRCLIPASGFYEWAKAKSGKQPYYIFSKESELICFAGLWSKVEDQVSFTILTKAADGGIADLHHRSPVLVSLDAARDWFEGDACQAQEIVAASSTRDLTFYPVSPDVGRVANDYAALLERVENAPREEAFSTQRQLL